MVWMIDGARRRRQMVEPEGRLAGAGRMIMIWGAPGFRPAPQCYRRRNGDVKSGPGGGCVMPSAGAGVNTDASASAG